MAPRSADYSWLETQSGLLSGEAPGGSATLANITQGVHGKRLLTPVTLPSWLLVGKEVVEYFHLGSWIAERWSWFATGSGRLFVLAFALVWLFVVVLWPEDWWPIHSGAMKPPIPTPATPISELLNKQAKEIASLRLDELLQNGQRLSANKPQKEDTANFSRIWNAQVAQWMNDVGTLLQTHWTQQDKRFFLSLTGENPHQFAIGVHPESARLSVDLLRYLKNLEVLKQQFSRS